jgi:hypothetical protein
MLPGTAVQPRNRARWGLIAVVVAAVCLFRWSWRRWPDVLIDFGREMYTPWQLTLGKHLYRDVAWFNGPLSAYFNSGWFRLLGVSLMTIVGVNAVLLACMMFLLYALLTALSGTRSAVAGLLAFVAVFAFTQGDEHGNYNYICPYSHELTHGLLLALVVLYLLFAYMRTGRRDLVSLAGATLGLVTLTKVEVCLSAWLACAAGFGMLLVLGLRSGRAVIRDGLILLGTASLAPLLAFILLSRAMTASTAGAGLIFPYKAVFMKSLTTSSYYRFAMGTDEVGQNLVMMLLWVGAIAAMLLPGASVGRLGSNPQKARLGIAVATLAALAGVAVAWRVADVREISRALPLLLIFFSVALVVQHRRRPRDASDQGASDGSATAEMPRVERATGAETGGESVLLAQRLTFAVFAFVLLWKNMFRANLYNYGFALSMPATMFAVCGLIDWLPQWAARLPRWMRGRTEPAGSAGTASGPGRALRSAAIAMLCGLILLHLGNVRQRYRAEDNFVSTGRDAIRTDIRGVIVNRALEEIGREVAPGQSIAVFPEGVMLNYLARRSSSIRFVNFMPPELALFGEDAIVAELDAHPPDFIAFFYRPTNEYGYRGLGTDYGIRIADWIRRHYSSVKTIEGAPGTQLFGRLVLLHRME